MLLVGHQNWGLDFLFLFHILCNLYNLIYDLQNLFLLFPAETIPLNPLLFFLHQDKSWIQLHQTKTAYLQYTPVFTTHIPDAYWGATWMPMEDFFNVWIKSYYFSKWRSCWKIFLKLDSVASRVMFTQRRYLSSICYLSLMNWWLGVVAFLSHVTN